MKVSLGIKILLSGCFFMLSCSTEDEDFPFSSDMLIGKWKYTEAYISAGGPHYWVSVDGGEEIEFFINGTFISNRFSDCSSGTYLIDDGNLSLKYECSGFVSGAENENGFITSRLEGKSSYFLLTATSGPICIEGCKSKYVRLESD